MDAGMTEISASDCDALLWNSHMKLMREAKYPDGTMHMYWGRKDAPEPEVLDVYPPKGEGKHYMLPTPLEV